MALTKAKVSFVEGVDGAVLTGAMPALDGSSLTGIAGMTKVTSDPLITTNPSSGVGTTWVNKSTGELFGCVDATAGANIWVNIGGGSGDVYRWHGQQHGYAAGGGAGAPDQDRIDKFTFSSSVTVTDVGNLSAIRRHCSGTQY